MEKRNQYLTALLVVQLALAVLTFWPRSATSEAAAGPLLDDFEAGEVTAFTVSDADGNRIELAREGDEWVLPEADDFPANSSQVETFLGKVAKLQKNRLVTQTEGSHARLMVAEDEFERLVELRLEDGNTERLFIGSSGGPSATHVRLANEPEVYLTGDLAVWDANTQPGSWVDTTYVSVPLTETVGLTLQNTNGTFEFSKEGESWTMEGLDEDETFNEEALTSMLGQITSLQMVRPLGKTEDASYGLDDPRAEAILETEAGEMYTLAIGAEDSEDLTAVAKWSESPYYVRISDATANSLVDKTEADFIQSPTPAPSLELEATPVTAP
ncbi:MAG: DUF4340 domain-containing protein [Chloroflexota bacterium]|nr:DUF4340 domain-containing protein [Chloroflexota bacterium]